MHLTSYVPPCISLYLYIYVCICIYLWALCDFHPVHVFQMRPAVTATGCHCWISTPQTTPKNNPQVTRATPACSKLCGPSRLWSFCVWDDCYDNDLKVAFRDPRISSPHAPHKELNAIWNQRHIMVWLFRFVAELKFTSFIRVLIR